MAELKLHPNIEIRYHADGTVDEIIVSDGKEVLLHLEQMGDDQFWIGLAPDSEPHDLIHVDIVSDSPITAKVRD